jgi:hypothetical protein
MSRRDEGDFLSRWSGRKLKARAEAAPEPAPREAPPPDPPDLQPGRPAQAEKTDAEILDELGLPDPDTLVKGDDFAAFLRAAIPARLRQRALRRLWLSDPVLANLDGLNDYEQDFTDKATARPDLTTAYRAGEGLLREAKRIVEQEPAASPPSERTPNEAGAAGSTEGEPQAPERGPPRETGEPNGARLAGGTAEGTSDLEKQPPGMRFRFGAG